MPDQTITTEQLVRVAPHVAAFSGLALPTATGRYVVIRQLEKVEAAVKPFSAAEMDLIDRIAVPGSKKQVGQSITFDIKPDAREEYTTQRAALFAEPVTLTGVRALTRAELGETPITVAADRVLVECGLLEKMPDEAV